MADTMGPEWGALAGYPMEEGAKILAQYAKEAEDKLTAQSGDEDDDDLAPSKPDNTLDFVKNLKRDSLAPAAAEFVSKRELARSQARDAISAKGKEWNDYATYVEQYMATADPTQQTNATAWHETWWWVKSLADRQAEEADATADKDDDPTPPRTESDEIVESRVVQGSMNADRSTRQPVRDMDSKKYRITDPQEQHTKDNFDRLLGVKMSDEEWYKLQNENVNTLEDYEALQEDLKKGQK